MLRELLDLLRKPDVSEPTATESPLTRWAAQVAEGIEAMERTAHLPDPPPLTGDHGADAEALLALLARLGCDPHSPAPGAARNAVFQNRSQQALRWGVNAAEEALRFLDHALARLAGHTPQLLTGDAPGLVKLSPAGGGLYAAFDLGHPDFPAGHPARALLPAAELFGDPPRIFVLGPWGRPWFHAGEAAELTRRLAREDRASREANRRRLREEQECQDARHKALWEASPAGREAKAEAERRRVEERLAALEAAKAG